MLLELEGLDGILRVPMNTGPHKAMLPTEKNVKQTEYFNSRPNSSQDEAIC